MKDKIIINNIILIPQHNFWKHLFIDEFKAHKEYHFLEILFIKHLLAFEKTNYFLLIIFVYNRLEIIYNWDCKLLLTFTNFFLSSINYYSNDYSFSDSFY